jgi:hypothetical protein
MKKSLLALSILLSASAMADYKVIMSGNGGNIKLPESPEPQTNFVSHTFTNCGQTGRFGPSQSQCQSAYSGDEILQPEYNYTVLGGIQQFTVPANGNYKIEAYGAMGGDGFPDSPSDPGKGAYVSGVFQLEEGNVIKVLVGQRGIGSHQYTQSETSRGASGGGGGSFVVKNSSPLIIAAGGNGSNWQNWNADGPDGSHIQGTNKSGSGERGAGGAGFSNNGGDATQGDSTGGASFSNGGTGGKNDSIYPSAVGGFGGGGGARFEGGGGGGYQGGTVVPSNQYDTTFPSYGAKSFNSGTNKTGQTGVNTGHGSVIITIIE